MKARHIVTFGIPILIALDIIILWLVDIPWWFIILSLAGLIILTVIVIVIIFFAWQKLGLH